VAWLMLPATARMLDPRDSNQIASYECSSPPDFETI